MLGGRWLVVTVRVSRRRARGVGVMFVASLRLRGDAREAEGVRAERHGHCDDPL